MSENNMGFQKSFDGDVKALGAVLDVKLVMV